MDETIIQLPVDIIDLKEYIKYRYRQELPINKEYRLPLTIHNIYMYHRKCVIKTDTGINVTYAVVQEDLPYILINVDIPKNTSKLYIYCVDVDN